MLVADPERLHLAIAVATFLIALAVIASEKMHRTNVALLGAAIVVLAELFLHHRVLIVPVASAGRVHAIVTRSDFFAALVGRFGAIAEDRGDSPA